MKAKTFDRKFDAGEQIIERLELGWMANGNCLSPRSIASRVLVKRIRRPSGE